MVKYEMLKNDTKVVDGVTVYRIVALKDFGDVKKGDLGGYIEYYTNLSLHDDCWIYDNAVALGCSTVEQSATVRDNAIIKGKVYLANDCTVSGNAIIDGNIIVGDFVEISENAVITGRAVIMDEATIKGNTKIKGGDKALETVIGGNVSILGDDNEISGDISLKEDLTIAGGARITGKSDVLHITGVFNGEGCITKYTSKDGFRFVTREAMCKDGLEVGSTSWEEVTAPKVKESVYSMIKAFELLS